MITEKKYLRWGVLGILLISLVLVLAACGGDDNGDGGTTPPPANGGTTPPPQSETPPEERDPVTLRFANWVAPDEKWMNITNSFSEKYPWVTVEWVNITPGNPMIEGLDQALAANNPIDVFWNNNFYAMLDYAEDLTPFIESDPEFQAFDFNPGINEPFQVDGRQMALSRGNDTFIIYYNLELLEKYGLQRPANDWTWDDLTAMATAATNPADGDYGIANTALWFLFGATTIPNANGSAPNNNMMNVDLTQSVADQPDVIEDMDYMAQWVRNGIMLNGARAAEAGAEGDLWVNGKSLFMLHVSPIIAIYNDQLTFEWDIAPYPAGTERQVGMSFNNPMFMSRASNHKEEAWLFMKYWGASVEGQNLLIAAGGSLPNSPNEEILEFFANAPVYANIDAEALAFAGSIGEIDPTIVMPGGNYLNDFVNGFAGAVFEGEQSVFEWSPPNTELLNNNIAAARAELGL